MGRDNPVRLSSPGWVGDPAKQQCLEVCGMWGAPGLTGEAGERLWGYWSGGAPTAPLPLSQAPGAPGEAEREQPAGGAPGWHRPSGTDTFQKTSKQNDCYLQHGRSETLQKLAFLKPASSVVCEMLFSACCQNKSLSTADLSVASCQGNCP